MMGEIFKCTYKTWELWALLLKTCIIFLQYQEKPKDQSEGWGPMRCLE